MDIICMKCTSTNVNQYFPLSKCTFSNISPHLTASQFFSSLSIIKLLHIFHLLVRLRRTGPIGHLLFFLFLFSFFMRVAFYYFDEWYANSSTLLHVQHEMWFMIQMKFWGIKKSTTIVQFACFLWPINDSKETRIQRQTCH